MTLKNLYRLLLLFVIILIIDQAIGSFLSYCSLKYKLDNRLELLLNDSLDKDIFIVGSSRALNGYSPEIIESKSDFTCYNLAVSGSNIEFHETQIDLILKAKNKPGKIIYNLDDCATLTDIKGKVIYPIDQFYPYVKYDEINKLVAKRMDKTLWPTYISKTYRNNVNFISSLKYLRTGKEKPSLEINNIDNYGSNLMEGKAKGYENMKFENNNPYKFTGVYLPYKEALERIIKKCNDSKVELIFVNPPIFFKANDNFIDEVKNISKNDVKLLDYSSLFSSNEYFYNYGHLNKKGAVKFSEQLISDIKKN